MKKIFNNNKIIKKMEDRDYTVIFWVTTACLMAIGLMFLLKKNR